MRATRAPRHRHRARAGAAWRVAGECGDDCAEPFHSARGAGDGRTWLKMDVESRVAVLHQATPELGTGSVGAAVLAGEHARARRAVRAAAARSPSRQPRSLRTTRGGG